MSEQAGLSPVDMTIDPLGLSNTAISTVSYGEITPRFFLGCLITLPLLAFGLLLIALPSFVLGRKFSIVWNEMTNGQTPRTPYANSGQGYAQSELVRLFFSFALTEEFKH